MRLSRLFRRAAQVKPDKRGIVVLAGLWPAFERRYRKGREMARRRRQIARGTLRVAP